MSKVVRFRPKGKVEVTDYRNTSQYLSVPERVALKIKELFTPDEITQLIELLRK